MSNTRVKIMAAESTDILEKQANGFLSQEDIELKELHYMTDGYEKPYSMAILYHEKDAPVGKRQDWKKKVFGGS